MSDSLRPQGMQHTSLPCLSQSPKFPQTHVRWVSDAIQPSHPLSPPYPALNLSQHQGLFQSVGSSHQVAKVLELQLSISSSNEYSRLISFRIDRFDQSVPSCPRDSQESSSAQFTIRKHQLFGVQPCLWSNSHIRTWLLEKMTALTIRAFVSKVISLLFNTLFRFVIGILPRRKHLLISWLQWLSTVILNPKKIKSVTASTFSPSICHEVMGLDAMILVFWMLSFKPAFSLSAFTLIKRPFSSSISLIVIIKHWLHSLAVQYILVAYLFHTQWFVLLNPLPLFYSFSLPAPYW